MRENGSGRATARVVPTERQRDVEDSTPYKREALDYVFRGCACSPCGNVILWRIICKSVQRQGGSKEGRSPLLCRFKGGVQGRGNRNPLPWRAFSFCPLSLCTSKEKMDADPPGQNDQRGPPRAAAPTGEDERTGRGGGGASPVPNKNMGGSSPPRFIRSSAGKIPRRRTGPPARGSAASSSGDTSRRSCRCRRAGSVRRS